jgi:cytoskeletal protein RodZ
MSSINERLKATRLEKNISIEKVASDLNIRKQYLIAIEEEDYTLTPGKVYTEGYLKLYANYLEVDFDLDATSFKFKGYKHQAHNLNKPYTESNSPSQFYILMSVIAIILVSYIWSFYTKVNNQSNNIIPSISFYNLQDRQFLKSRYDIIINSNESASERKSLNYFLANYPFLNEQAIMDKNKAVSPLKEGFASNKAINNHSENNNTEDKKLRENLNFSETQVEEKLGTVTNNVTPN